MRNLYEILELASEATLDEIKKAYRRLAQIYHPDKNGGKQPPEWKEISIAYEVLMDEEKRDKYDRTGQFDNKVHDTKQRILAELAALFSQSIDNFMQNGVDIFSLMKAALYERSKQISADIMRFQKRETKLRELLHRMMKDGEKLETTNRSDLFFGIVSKELEWITNNVGSANEMLEMLDEMSDILDGYELEESEDDDQMQEIISSLVTLRILGRLDRENY